MRGVLRALLASGLGLMCSVLLVELAARIVFANVIVYDVEMSKYATRVKRSSDNMNISHEHVPGSNTKLMGVEVDINSFGYRDEEYPVERIPGSVRVLMLGDSITFGWGVDEGNTFSSLLEQDLARQLIGKVEVINSGVGNYNTVQQVAAFKKHGSKLSPDCVVVNFFLNDAEPTPQRSRVAGLLEHFQSLVFMWSRYDFLMRSVGQRPDAITYYTDLYGASDGWKAARESLTELKGVTSSHGAKLLLVLIPDLHIRDGQYPFLGVHEAVTDFAISQGIPTIDLLPYFQGVDDMSMLWVSADDAHPNSEGHRLIADGIRDTLIDQCIVEFNP